MTNEVNLPTSRQVAVARAYVQGLELDRERLHRMEQSLNEQVWEIVKLGSYCRALTRVLARVLSDVDTGRYDPSIYDCAEGLIADAIALNEQVFPCPCGHARHDHDEDGCTYLGCRNICGGSDQH